MDVRGLEQNYLGKNIEVVKQEYGNAKSVLMVTDKEFNVQKKLVYDDFTVQTKNDVCTRFTKRLSSTI